MTARLRVIQAIALRLSMLWGAFALTLGSCSATETVGEAACTLSQPRCNLIDSGFVFQICGSDNHFTTSAVCSANQVCDENLGCVDCFPGTSICNEAATEVHACSTDGTIGPLVLPCGADAVHANWNCVAGTCVFDRCQPGYYDLDGDRKCEYACTFVSAIEACNGADDNCNGIIDEGLEAPSPTKVCGVSPAAVSAACTTGVTIVCKAGAWKCTFPTGVCSPSCATAVEIFDKLDNDCDGLIDEP